MTRLLLAAFALLAALAPGAVWAVEQMPHYRVAAKVDASGKLDADVTITIPHALLKSDKAFLLGRRFTLDRVDTGGDATVTTEPVEVPVDALNKIAFHFKPGLRGDVALRFRYHGPFKPVNDEGVTPIKPEGWEIFLDQMWIPFGADLQTRFTADATINGIPKGFIAVAQGKVTRTATGVHIVRDTADIDLPLVAVPGLKRATGPGVEFYARDLGSPLAQRYLRHAKGAAAYLQGWFGPLRAPIRLAMVVRKRPIGYARAGYTIVSETERPVAEAGSNDPRMIEASSGRHIAHEFAHAWWLSASPLGEDFWLVESMAEYCSLRYVDAAFGPTLATRLFDVKRKDAATAGPIMGHGRPNKLQLYEKGPLLLLDLEHRIGRARMDRLLAETAPDTPNTTAKFLAALSRIAGADAARDFDAALHAG